MKISAPDAIHDIRYYNVPFQLTSTILDKEVDQESD